MSDHAEVDKNAEADPDNEGKTEDVSPASLIISDMPENDHSQDSSPEPSSSSSSSVTPLASSHHLEDPHVAHAQHHSISHSQSVSKFITQFLIYNIICKYFCYTTIEETFWISVILITYLAKIIIK